MEKNERYLFLACIIREMTETNPFSSTKKLYGFLYTELLRFEDHFKGYLSNEVSKTNSYLAKANERIDKLTNNERTNILSFNYTSPFKDSSNIVNFRNVHGDLDHHCIIGIDQVSINGNGNRDDDEYNYRFTKTYRIMQLASDRQEKHILNKNIKSIVFYGHSLAAADYSYFQSIFDFYSIYDSDVTLVFYYSVYDKNKKEEIIKTQFDSIRKLLLEYGDTLDNKDHGKNLLHKLLLEDRLIIKELVLDDSNHEEK